MKNIVLYLIILIAVTIFFVSCGQKENANTMPEISLDDYDQLEFSLYTLVTIELINDEKDIKMFEKLINKNRKYFEQIPNASELNAEYNYELINFLIKYDDRDSKEVLKIPHKKGIFHNG